MKKSQTASPAGARRDAPRAGRALYGRARNRSARDIQNSDIQPCTPPGRRRRSSPTTSAANAIGPRRETSSHLTIGHSLIWKCVRLSNEDASRNSSPRPLAKQISYFTKRTLRNRSTTPPPRAGRALMSRLTALCSIRKVAEDRIRQLSGNGQAIPEFRLDSKR